ncbi:signal peptidase I SipW [Fictibacillus sp. 18YEL24]|uniref:signal peptidase I SipW n=1 Tax=Fictibacillus sp. 18YEL24 TaxID=2745875 RepID=UPI0018CD15CE|nr:signal peptidase I [Fictibacillus sp. 18YEL24]MBH0169145.1 signal peptidase I [Fictibacillus sp. 18YEL24]
MKALKWVNHLITFLLSLLLIALVFSVIISKASGGEPQIMGYQLKSVLSGSMEPGIKTGSVIAIKPGGDMTRFQKGDVITFKVSNDKLITHRVMGVKGAGDNTQYITKGDNNNTEDLDPVLAANVVAEYKGFTIPYTGYLLNAAQSKAGSALLLILPGVLLLFYSAVTIWKAIKEVEVKKDAPSTSN